MVSSVQLHEEAQESSGDLNGLQCSEQIRMKKRRECCDKVPQNRNRNFSGICGERKTSGVTINSRRNSSQMAPGNKSHLGGVCMSRHHLTEDQANGTAYDLEITVLEAERP